MYGHKTHGYNGDLFSMSQRTAQVANKAVTVKADQATAPQPITPIDHKRNVTDDQWGAIIVDAGQTILEETLAGNTLRLQDIKAILPTENTADWSNTCNAIEAAVIAWIRTHLDITVEPQEVIRAITDFAKRLPTHTIADEVKRAMQQFSTPPAYAYVAATALKVVRGNVYLEPSAGTGLLAVFVEKFGGELVLNELNPVRKAMLARLFPNSLVTNENAEYLHVHPMIKRIAIDGVIMNPPFSASPLHYDGKNRSNVTHKHLNSAHQCLQQGGRLVVITGNNTYLGTANFASLVAGQAYYKHGTTFDTQLAIYDGTKASLHIRDCLNIQELSAAVQIYLTGRHTDKNMRVFKQAVAPAIVEPIAKPISTVPVSATPSPVISADVSTDIPEDTHMPSTVMEAVELMPEEERHYDVMQPLSYEATFDQAGAADAQTSSYMPYNPTVNVGGAWKHPTKLVESGAMASVTLPKPTYKPSISQALAINGALSEAQLETVVYAGEAHSRYLDGVFIRNKYGEVLPQTARSTAFQPVESNILLRRGFFLGDGTGCGKGRQAAAIILDHWSNPTTTKRKAIWLSMNDKLLEDARRDWIALGGKPSHVFLQGSVKQGEKLVSTLGEDDESICFSTYSTMRMKAKGEKEARVDQLINWFGKDYDGVIIFDESHAMAGAAPIGNLKKPSQQGIAGTKLQDALPHARIVYVSATGATQIENLAYATRLGLWGTKDMPFRSRSDFLYEIDSGGVNALEMVACNLKAMGLYIARSLSFEGVEYELVSHSLSAGEVAIYNTYSEVWRHISKKTDEAMLLIDAKSGFIKALLLSAFESSKQRFFNQLLLSMKTATLIERIEQDLAEGHSAVVQLVSTMEANLNNKLKSLTEQEIIDFDVTPRDMICQYLETGFPVHQHVTTVDATGRKRSERMLDKEGNAIVNRLAEQLRANLMDDVAQCPPILGALDQLTQHFGTEAIAEVTGRSKRLVLKDGIPTIESRPTSSNKAETDRFMSGEKRILLFSQAGGTGRSYHADKDCGNHQRRMHYILEPGWRADNVVQGIGRTNRTNQVSAPVVLPVFADVPGEARFKSTIARKLDSLGALTRGQRETGSNGAISADENLESVESKASLNMLLMELSKNTVAGISGSEFTDLTGIKLRSRDNDGNIQDVKITTFLNRVLAMPIDKQNVLFEAFMTFVTQAVLKATAEGTLSQKMRVIEGIKMEVSTVPCENLADGVQIRRIANTVPYNPFTHTEVAELLFKRSFMARRTVSGLRAVKKTSQVTRSGIEYVNCLIVDYTGPRTATYSSIGFDRTFAKVNKNDFVAAWRRGEQDLPATRDEEHYLITGQLLKEWLRLSKSSTQLYQVCTPEGQRYLGRTLELKDVEMLQAGRSLRDDQMDVREIITAVQEGVSVKVDVRDAQKPIICRTTHMGSMAYEMQNVPRAYEHRLIELGIKTLRHGGRTRYFLPYDGTDLKATEKVIRNLAGEYAFSKVAT